MQTPDLRLPASRGEWMSAVLSDSVSDAVWQDWQTHTGHVKANRRPEAGNPRPHIWLQGFQEIRMNFICWLVGLNVILIQFHFWKARDVT